MRTRRHTRAIRAVLFAAVAAALLAIAPAAGAHELFEERAETAVENYARVVSGGNTQTMTVNGPEGLTNIQVNRFDAGRCRARGPHQRVCPLVYEGEDYLESNCRLEPVATDDSSNSTSECFRNIVCRQTVVVTLRGPHRSAVPRTRTGRDLTLRASRIRCGYEGNSSSPDPSPAS